MRIVIPKALLFILLISLLFIDFLFYLYRRFPSGVIYFREVLIISVVVAFALILKGNKIFESKEMGLKLKGLYLALAGIYFAFALPNILLTPLSGYFPFVDRSHSYFFGSLRAFLSGFIVSITTAVILIGVLMILRDLIYYKRKRASARTFRLLLILFGLEIIFSIYQKSGHGPDSNLGALTIPRNIFFFLLINLMVINSLRNSWVNYLNKRQKINCLWLGLPLLTGAIIFEIFFARSELITEYSVSLAAFVNSAGLFLSIYLGMGFFSLLLHLPTAGIFDRKIKEVESLHDLGRTVSSVLDPEQIGKMITIKAAAVINCDALWLELLDSASERRTIVSSENLQVKGLDIKSTDGLADWIIQERKSVLINEVARDSRCRDLKGWSKKEGSILGIPLISQSGALGILFATKAQDYSYDEEDRKLLQAFANQATIALENARLIKELVVKERLEQELRVAHEAQ
ncbi:MAG: GAF domain-containing protein, partial [bacterium]